MTPNLDPVRLSARYVTEVQSEVATVPGKIQVVGLIASKDKPSMAYARATQQKFDDVGIAYDLRHIERLQLEEEILRLNDDPTVHGIFIYFPVFHNQQDEYLRNLVDFRKDIEAGSDYWTRKLYKNDRLAMPGDTSKKAVIPCTPLAILKMLTEVGVYDESEAEPLADKTVTIFNRSEVIGRPLAVMMSNDGARVYSFDEHGPLMFHRGKITETTINRPEALANSDIVVTGVPQENFPMVSAREIPPGTVCVNFSSVQNFADDINTHTELFLPRVGPMTVAMCMRNAVRLFLNFHQEYPNPEHPNPEHPNPGQAGD